MSSTPQVMAKPPVSNVLGNVCGNLPGGAGRKRGAPVLSVVGTVLSPVKRGAVDMSSKAAGLVNVVDRPNEPVRSKVVSRP